MKPTVDFEVTTHEAKLLLFALMVAERSPALTEAEKPKIGEMYMRLLRATFDIKPEKAA